MTLRKAAKSKKALGLSPQTFAIIAACLIVAGVTMMWTLRPHAKGEALIGGPFQLVNAAGQTVTDADFRGKPFLVFFGYTHCPDVCPMTLAEISDVLQRLPDKTIKALFITVDPERDTAKLMADYVSSFDPRMIGLSGSPDQIAAAEKAYRVYARKAPGKDGDYTMDHSSIVYLMDANGAFVEAFNLDRPPEESAKELAKYF
jgi:protein SCO1/2